MRNNHLQKITQKTKERARRTSLKAMGELSKDWCFSKLATPRVAKRRKYIRVCKRSNTMAAHVEQEMNTVPEHLCSPMVFKIYYYFGLT
jgi:hypothetical protein